MILEILAIFLLLLLIDCASRISRLIVRRRDVLHYVQSQIGRWMTNCRLLAICRHRSRQQWR